MFFDLRTVIGFNKASTCTCSFPFFDAIVLGIRILHVNATLHNPQYILFLTLYWHLQKPGWYRKNTDRTQKRPKAKNSKTNTVLLYPPPALYMWRAVNGWAVDKVLLYVKEAIGVIGMLSSTKDQPANTEEKKSLTLCFTDFSDLLFHRPASRLVSMYLKTYL